MIYGAERDPYRRIFVEAWRKHRQGLPLEVLETLIVALIGEHPEYHRLLEQPDMALAKDFHPQSAEANPFLHLAMHLTLREQVSADRPPGVAAAFRAEAARQGDTHRAEHRMMERLGRILWEGQSRGLPPDETAYLACLQGLSGS